MMILKSLKYQKIIFFLLFVLFSNPVSASSIHLSGKTDAVFLNPDIEFLEDSHAIYTIEDVTKPEMAAEFKQSKKTATSFGYTNSVFWIRFTLINTTTQQLNRYLELAHPFMKLVDLYYSQGDKPFVHRFAGLANRSPKNEVGSRNHVFSLDFSPKSTTQIFMRFENDGPMNFPLRLWTPKAFIKKASLEQTVLGLFYGIVIALLIYNLSICVSLRDRNYLFYVLFLSMLLIYQLNVDGIGYQYLWAGSQWMSLNSTIVSWNLIIFFYFLFTSFFLNARENAPRLNRVLFFMIGLSMVNAIYSQFGDMIFSIKTAFYLQLLTTLLAMIICLICLFKKERSAWFYFSAMFLFLGGTIMSLLKNAGVIEPTFISVWGVHLGTMAETMILSIGLSDRINKIRKERIKAQNESLANKQLAISSLQKADAIKNQFLSNTSHELRTPLNGIIGIAEILINGAAGPLSEQARKYLFLILSSGRRLTTLINDILDYSKLQNRGIDLNIEPVDLHQLTDVVLILLHPLSQTRKIDLQNQIPEDFPSVKADEDRLQQILFNLIENGIKFTDQGSVVVSANLDGKNVMIHVEDSGSGIEKADFERIFNSFEQIEEFSERQRGGTGLGLAITRELVELHGGSINVRSTPGKGSVFTFTLPASASSKEWRTENPKQREETTVTNHFEEIASLKDLANIDISKLMQSDSYDKEKTHVLKSNQCSVLIVDDDPINLLVIESFLLAIDATVRTAESGEECLRMMSDWKPDIVLLDIMMPKMNGYKTAQKIRERCSKTELPIIFVSAKNRVSDLIDGFNAEANDYITKPVIKDILLTRIEFHVSLSRAVNELKHSKYRIQQILNNAVEGIIQFSLDGDLQYVNPAVADMFGYSGEEDMLSSISSIELFFEHPENYIAIYDHLKVSHQINGFEASLIRKDGTTFYGLISIRTIDDLHDQNLFAEGMILDVSDRHKRENAERKREIAEQANLAKSEFLENVTHELRTPMHGILGYTKLGLHRLSDLSEEKIREYLQMIQVNGTRLLELINDLLDLSRLELNTMVLDYETLSFSELIKSVLSELNPLIAEKVLQVSFQSPDFDDFVRVDKEKISQLLRNLIGNAIKYTNKEGEIVIELHNKDARLWFLIEDNGVGLIVEDIEKIFEKFERSKNARFYAKGNGLGLAISKKIVEAHQGKIWAETVPDGGACFRFWIPTKTV